MKLYWCISQGCPIEVSVDEQSTLKWVNKSNAEYDEYVQKCIEEFEPYSDTSIEVYEVDLCTGDRFSLNNNMYEVIDIESPDFDDIEITALDLKRMIVKYFSKYSTENFDRIYPINENKWRKLI